jgi:hypothetical protein
MGEYVESAIAYLQANPLIAAAVGLVLLYLLVRKTKVFLFLLLLAAVLGGVLYLIADVAGTGGAAKRKLIDQTATQDAK